MDIHKISLLLNIVEIGSFNRAATKLGYSHSGLLHIVNSLESEVGFPLLERKRTGVFLSAQGRLLEPYFKQLLALDTKINQEIEAIAKAENKSSLSIGAFYSMSTFLLPRLLQKFMQEHININISMNVSGNIPELLEKDIIELGIISKDNAGSFEWLHLMDDPYLAVIPSDIGYSENDSIEIEELMKLGLVVATGNQHNVALQTIKKITLAKNIKNDITLASYDGHALISMVEHGLCVGLLPGLYKPRCPENVIMIPTNPPITREIGIICKSFNSVSPAGRIFLSFIQDWFRNPPV